MTASEPMVPRAMTTAWRVLAGWAYTLFVAPCVELWPSPRGAHATTPTEAKPSRALALAALGEPTLGVVGADSPTSKDERGVAAAAAPAAPARRTSCSKGWASRCPAAKGRRCTCHCRGENHGTANRPRPPAELFA